MKIEHVAFNVADVDKSADWMVENLGLRIVRRMDTPPFMTFLADSSDETILELYYNPNYEVPNYWEISPYTLHIAFRVEDAEAVVAKLVAAGAVQVGEFRQTEAGDKSGFIRDPNGISLQFIERQIPLLPD